MICCLALIWCWMVCDNFESRYMVSAAAARAGIAHVWATILGFDAQLSVLLGGTRSGV